MSFDSLVVNLEAPVGRAGLRERSVTSVLSVLSPVCQGPRSIAAAQPSHLTFTGLLPSFREPTGGEQGQTPAQSCLSATDLVPGRASCEMSERLRVLFKLHLTLERNLGCGRWEKK